MITINPNFANKVITKTSPRTSTSVTRVYDGFGQIISKTVTVGAENKTSKNIRSFATTFANGKAQTITCAKDYGQGIGKNLVMILNKMSGENKWKTLDIV